jgi:hypothetical protein
MKESWKIMRLLPGKGLSHTTKMGMRVFICCLLWICTQVPALLAEQSALQIERIETGGLQRGENRFVIVLNNTTHNMVTVVLDLRASPGLYFRNWQQQSIYLLSPGERRSIEAPYRFDHLTATGYLRVRLYYPLVTGAGATTLAQPFFEKQYAMGADRTDLDRLPFRTRESRHYLIYYYPDSLAERDIDRIADERDHGFDQVAMLLGVHYERKIPLFLFPDEDTKRKETGHQGAGMAGNGIIVEVYSQKIKLDPYHEMTHILASQLGYPAAMFNEGLAVYLSEELGADALHDLGSPGLSCDQAVRKDRSEGAFIPLSQLLGFDNIGPEASQPSVSYPEACSMVHFLISNYGLDKFRAAYPRVGHGDFKAFEAIYGISVADAERAWLASLSTGKLK